MSNFTLGRLLGASNLSEVFQAHKDGRNYALKRILHPEHRDLLKREFDCLKKLHHPNIIAYRESFLEELFATLYIVMEHAEVHNDSSVQFTGGSETGTCGYKSWCKV